MIDMTPEMKAKTSADKFAPFSKGGDKFFEKVKQQFKETGPYSIAIGLTAGIAYGSTAGPGWGAIAGVSCLIAGYLGERISKKVNGETVSDIIVAGIKKLKRSKDK